jgi:hypothetical protein
MFKFGGTLRLCPCDRTRRPTAAGRRIRDAGSMESKLGLLNSSKGASREKAVDLPFTDVESRLTGEG